MEVPVHDRADALLLGFVEEVRERVHHGDNPWLSSCIKRERKRNDLESYYPCIVMLLVT
jgi:hypothetical protein